MRGANWSTTSFGDDPEASPIELSALGDHLQQCNGSSGRVVAMRCGAQRLHGFVAERFVTTLALLALLIGIALLAL
jgi:hypothetical protein